MSEGAKDSREDLQVLEDACHFDGIVTRIDFFLREKQQVHLCSVSARTNLLLANVRHLVFHVVNFVVGALRITR